MLLLLYYRGADARRDSAPPTNYSTVLYTAIKRFPESKVLESALFRGRRTQGHGSDRDKDRDMVARTRTGTAGGK